MEHETDKTVAIAQSMAICRFLAKRANLIPSNDMYQAKCDMICDAIADWRAASYKAFFAKEREAALHEYVHSKLLFYLNKFEKLLSCNQEGKSKYFVGKKLTWADLAVFDILEENEHLENLQSYPCLANFKQSIQNRPNIKAYLQRPDRPKGF